MSTDVKFQGIDELTPAVKQVLDPKEPLPVSVANCLRLACSYKATEVCGLITNTYELVYVDNVHPEPELNFAMDPDDFRRQIERISVADERVIAVFHTHPGGLGRPSANDIAGWPNRDLGWRYFIATRDAVYEFEYQNQPEHTGMFSGMQVR